MAQKDVSSIISKGGGVGSERKGNVSLFSPPHPPRHTPLFDFTWIKSDPGVQIVGMAQKDVSSIISKGGGMEVRAKESFPSFLPLILLDALHYLNARNMLVNWPPLKTFHTPSFRQTSPIISKGGWHHPLDKPLSSERQDLAARWWVI